MPTQKQVNVGLDAEQKERWEKAVETDPRFATMSALIRVSVEKELSDDTPEQRQVGGKELSEVSDRIMALENQISGLSSDFQELKGVVKSQTPTDQNLKSEVFAALPEGGDGIHSPATPEEITEKIGGPVAEEDVHRVLEDLASSTGQVQSHIGTEEGDVRYDKRGD